MSRGQTEGRLTGYGGVFLVLPVATLTKKKRRPPTEALLLLLPWLTLITYHFSQYVLLLSDSRDAQPLITA